MSETGNVTVTIADGVATVHFFHPKKNSLPGPLLRQIAAEIDKVGANDEARVVVLASGGDGPFCAGASFDELTAIDDLARGKEFFSGFSSIVLAMKKCPKFVVARVHGKVVGGGVGVVSAADYALATDRAAIKLSELALGIGPFVIAPCVERKIGFAAFSALSVDTDWRDAAWAKQHGLYAEVFADTTALDEALAALTKKLASFSPQAMADLKAVFWEGTDHWEQLLAQRAETSGRLVLSDYTTKAIAAFRKK